MHVEVSFPFDPGPKPTGAGPTDQYARLQDTLGAGASNAAKRPQESTNVDMLGSTMLNVLPLAALMPRQSLEGIPARRDLIGSDAVWTTTATRLEVVAPHTSGWGAKHSGEITKYWALHILANTDIPCLQRGRGGTAGRVR